MLKKIGKSLLLLSLLALPVNGIVMAQKEDPKTDEEVIEQYVVTNDKKEIESKAKEVKGERMPFYIEQFVYFFFFFGFSTPFFKHLFFLLIGYIEMLFKLGKFSFR